MKTRILGNGLTVSAVSLGCMGFTHAYGAPMEDAEGAKVIAQAVDLGYLYFDTAECYIGERADGSIAYNEDLVGTALKPYRHQVVIATKFGVKHVNRMLEMDARPETIPKAGGASERKDCPGDPATDRGAFTEVKENEGIGAL